MKLQDYIAKGITIRNNMGETKKTRADEGYISIVFPNGWIASIVIDPKEESGKYSVAVCDYEGYFNWNILIPFGTYKGTILCNTEKEVCKALSIIEKLRAIA